MSIHKITPALACRGHFYLLVVCCMTISIICALDEERTAIITALKDYYFTQKEDNLYTCVTGKRDLITVSLSGIGKVNAAALTQHLVDRFNPDYVLFSGVAGALQPGVHAGDLVVGLATFQYDVDVTGLGSKPGEIPGEKTIYSTSSLLSSLCQTCAGLVYRESKVLYGAIATGDTFICDEGDRAYALRFSPALCCDMESAAVAQVLSHYPKIHYLPVRGISDSASEKASDQYTSNLAFASENAARLVTDVVNLLIK